MKMRAGGDRFFVFFLPLLCGLLFLGLFLSPRATRAQTPGGTVITAQATGTYTDDANNSYSTASNTVTVTVANVAGLVITPDGGAGAAVVPGEQSGVYQFTVTNTGNVADQVTFLANGASIQVTGSATLLAAVIDLDNSGTINAGDIDIATNSSTVTSPSIPAGGSLHVLVRVAVSTSASVGSQIQIALGDASTGGPSFDDQPADNSAHEVATVRADVVNGRREARGDVTINVEQDAAILATISQVTPSAPYARGAVVTVQLTATNVGGRALNGVQLSSQGVTAIHMVLPISSVAELAPGQSLPAGTLYTQAPLTQPPTNSAIWSATPPSDLSTVTRVAVPVATTLSPNAAASVSIQVRIRSTANTSLKLLLIADMFGKSAVTNFQFTDQTGDTVPNAGDGNANFDEGDQPGNIDGNGVIQRYDLQTTYSLYLGPQGSPQASGPTDTNDDYTVRSVSPAAVGSGQNGGTTAATSQVVFTNSLQNAGTGDDVARILLGASTSLTVEASVDNGSTWATLSTSTGPTISVPFQQTVTVQVRVTVPSGTQLYTELPVTIKAQSTNDPTAQNSTVDVAQPGILRTTLNQSVSNGTGRGGPTDPVPGAEVTYTTTAANQARAPRTGCLTVSATNPILVFPIPANTDFKLNSVTTNVGSTGLTVAAVEYSQDGGATWSYTPQSGGGGAPAGYDRNVTHLRVRFSGALAGYNNPISVTAVVRIR